MIGLTIGASAALLMTMVGAAGVFVVSRERTSFLAHILAFSAGMMALTVFEMLNESHALSGHRLALAGLFTGIAALFLLGKTLPHAHLFLLNSEMTTEKRKAALLAGSITIHNIPEGFAIAAAFTDSSSLGWLVAVSIAIQDVPEGFIVAMPSARYGLSRWRSFMCGAFSGVVEFAAAIAGFFCLSAVSKAIPFALGFSAGAMFYVILFELLPDAMQGEAHHKAAAAFVAGIGTAYLLSAIFGM